MCRWVTVQVLQALHFHTSSIIHPCTSPHTHQPSCLVWAGGYGRSHRQRSRPCHCCDREADGHPDSGYSYHPLLLRGSSSLQAGVGGGGSAGGECGHPHHHTQRQAAVCGGAKHAHHGGIHIGRRYFEAGSEGDLRHCECELFANIAHNSHAMRCNAMQC